MGEGKGLLSVFGWGLMKSTFSGDRISKYLLKIQKSVTILTGCVKLEPSGVGVSMYYICLTID